MKYAYTDIGGTYVNIAITLDDIDRLLDIISEIEDAQDTYTLRQFKKLLLESKENSAVLLESHARTMKASEDV